jgi:hypothetical protein
VKTGGLALNMNCPFCAEEIKEEALVCPHCQRDLAFFRPMEKRVRGLEKRLDVVAATLLEIRGQLETQTRIPLAGAQLPEPIRQLSTSRKVLSVVVEVLLTAAVVGILVALNVAIRPQPTTIHFQTSDMTRPVSADELKWQELESYEQRWKIIIRIFLPTVFLIPIGIGLGMGLRWPGRNLKWYIVLGAVAGTVEVLGLAAVTFVIDGAAYVLGVTAVFLGINLARCGFGFVAGGLIGDSIEKRRLRTRSQAALPPLASGMDPAHWADLANAANPPRSKLKMLTDAVPMASVLSLVGVVITSYFTYLATTQKSKDPNPIAPGTVSQPAPIGSTPSPNPIASPVR